MPTKTDWDNFYRTVNCLAPSEHQQYFFAKRVQEALRPGMAWLDAGCGQSLLPAWLKDAKASEQHFLSTAGFIVGCDRDFRSLATPRPIRRVACNLEQMAFEEDSFDLITCNLVVEHLERPAAAFGEFLRVLKPGGKAIILTPNLYHWATLVSAVTPHSLHQRILGVLLESNHEDVFPTRYRCNTAKALRETLSASGFSEVVIHTVVGRPHLVGLGPLLNLECLLNRFAQKHPLIHEVLCALAVKAAPASSLSSAGRPAQCNVASLPPKIPHSCRPGTAANVKTDCI